MEARRGEPQPIERKTFGSTGEVGKDGILTVEQQLLLNRIQENVAEKLFASLIDIKDPLRTEANQDLRAERGWEKELARSVKRDDLYPNPMVAMATGIGKGRITHLLLEKQMRQKPDSKVLLIAGTKLILVKQTHGALAGYQKQEGSNGKEYIESAEEESLTKDTASIEENPLEGEKSFLYKTGKLRQDKANVHVVTIQTLQSELKNGRIKPEDYDLLIVDEVHNIGTKRRKETIDKFDRVVGFTATPYRHSGTMKSPRDYGFEIVESMTLPEAQELRLLPPLLGIQIDTKDLVEEIPMTQTGLIDYKELEKVLKNSLELRPYIADRIAGIISDNNRKYKTVVAVNFVWEAEELAKLLKEKGIKVGIAVNQQSSKQINSEEVPAINTIERYKLPEDDPKSIQVLISPYVASEGFDAPATEVLVWASPTDSSLRYTQYTGRLARRADGKLFGVVVDCLYQTSQYNWSYNMGMWMKDDVRQLENGMLWLGPETSIENLKSLPQVEAIRRQADIKPIKDLQNEGLLEVQEADFPVTVINLNKTFMGRSERIVIAARKIAEIFREEPGLVVKRKSGSVIVDVITNKQAAIDEMIKKGFYLRTTGIQEVQDTDFPITTMYLMSKFIGSNVNLHSIAEQVYEEIAKKNPELVGKRKFRGRIVDVILDEQIANEEMKKRGISMKMLDLEDVKESDFPITSGNIKLTFGGADKTLYPILEIVINNNPDLFSYRITTFKNGHRVTAQVATDKEKIFEEMTKNGAKLKRTIDILEVQKSDFPLTRSSIVSTFYGESTKIMMIARNVLNRMREDGSEPTVIRRLKESIRTVEVVIDPDKFMEEMQKEGVELKEKNVAEAKQTDFLLNQNFLTSTFIGDYKKISLIKETVLEKIKKERPDLIVKRKNGKFTVEAIADKDFFIEEMLKEGAKLKIIQEIQDTDFPITWNSINKVFTGGNQRLLPIAMEILEFAQKQSPELITQRKNKTRNVYVILNRQWFIDEMIKRGVKLR
ncbi:MAG: DEAD/DEAH box helicase family protein [Candidatus Levybacteria bacterium]|nr:DEAD/DEAH box helicase family protein [Candidatus Levybacteria bacterium]